MAIYAISDLHLALSIDKPMDVFGGRWENYMERLQENWRAVVGNDDYVLVPGDISWATYLEQAFEDFSFIDALPGKKILSKGNHDYWWTTKSKLEQYISQNGFSTISFMHNNSYTIDGVSICGTRGWNIPGEDDFSEEDVKIYQRELQRLELSLKSVNSTEKSINPSGKGAIIAALHYPPFTSKGVFSEAMYILQKYNVNICIYGHLHGDASRNAVEGMRNGVEFRLVSADYLGFKPVRLI